MLCRLSTVAGLARLGSEARSSAAAQWRNTLVLKGAGLFSPEHDFG